MIEALSRTRRAAFGRVASLLGSSELNEPFWDELEQSLIGADLGVASSDELLESLKQRARFEGWVQSRQLSEELRSQLLARLGEDEPTQQAPAPRVWIVIGVNGSGKTTTAAKLAHLAKEAGQMVMLAAADTFRAAAAEQLLSWGERLGIEVIVGEPGSDPGAVVYNACQAARTKGVDLLVVDTSGRMHTSHNLMAELEKLVRVAGKVIPDSPHEVLLVLDATTGQNGLSQARAFAEAVPVTGAVLAKLDSSARGGIAFSIREQLNLPIRYVGLGEDLHALERFNPEQFVDGLLLREEALH